MFEAEKTAGVELAEALCRLENAVAEREQARKASSGIQPLAHSKFISRKSPLV